MPDAPGPFETAEEVSRHPAVRAIYDADHESTRRGVMAGMRHQLLEEACTAAGVDLGHYDHRMLLWLSGWDPETCLAVAGWVARAYEAGLAAGTAQNRTEGDTDAL